MGGITLWLVPYFIGGGYTANDIGFDNTGTHINATKIQGAINELDTRLFDIHPTNVEMYTKVWDVSKTVSGYNVKNILQAVFDTIPSNQQIKLISGLAMHSGSHFITGYLYPAKNYGGGVYISFNGDKKIWIVNNDALSVYSITTTA